MSENRNKMLYGSGVFTTAAIFENKPFRWSSHWQRLSANAARLGIDVSAYDESPVLQIIEKAAIENNISDGKARITFYDERAASLWSSDSGDVVTSLDVLIGKRQSGAAKFLLTTSPYSLNSRSPLAGIKSCNYLENILTLDEAKGRGFHEAVRMNENGHVTSAAMANIFWLRDGVVNTPSVTTGCLAGTTREYILENLNCREVEAQIEELQTADAIFLSSAGLGVVEVAEFDTRTLAPSDHPIKTKLPWAK